jgi:hypothetical protein
MKIGVKAQINKIGIKIHGKLVLLSKNKHRYLTE